MKRSIKYAALGAALCALLAAALLLPRTERPETEAALPETAAPSAAEPLAAEAPAYAPDTVAAAGTALPSDVLPGAWYEAEVREMYKAGVLKGYPDGTFRPDNTISAAEFIAILARQAGLSETPAQTSHWAAGLLETARNRGWYDWDELPPTGEGFDKPITRQLAAKVMMNALYPGVQGDYNVESAKMNDFSQLDGRYYTPVIAAYSVGLVKGDNNGNFNPKSGLTRAEACAMLSRAKKGSAVQPGTPDATQQPAQPSEQPVPVPTETVRGGVSENGWLQVKGTQLCNEAGEPVVLRGMSSHGLQWFPQYAGEQCIRNTAAFGANLFRAAMYTGEGGYLSNPDKLKKALVSAVDAAIANDMYVIIDWHILSDNDPSAHTDEAAAFFKEMTARYGDNPAVLYEICNEPNGGVTWKGNVKPYAEKAVAAIREGAPKSIILIGSPTWSQDVHEAAADPVKGTNLMYTVHFYAGTHGKWLRERIDDALKKGAPVFISEWGTSSADGNGGVFLKESAEWLDFLNARGISWANWSLCDKSETSAALKPGTPDSRAWTESDLSESGKFVFAHFND